MALPILKKTKTTIMKRNSLYTFLTNGRKITLSIFQKILILLFIGNSTSALGQQVPNDCILDAIDLTSQINSAMNEPSGWDCNNDLNFFFNGATSTTVTSTNSTEIDMWFSFVADPSHTAWLTVFEAGVDVTIELYEQTSPLNAICEPLPSASVDGLTFIAMAKEHCGFGGPRDVGVCSHSVHNRIDISNLNNGSVYYIRLTTMSAFPGEHVIVCVERNTVEAPEADRCPELNELIVGCGDLFATPIMGEFGTPNVNQTFTRLNGNNAGAFGNAVISSGICNPPPTCEPGNGIVQFFAGSSGERADCNNNFFSIFVGTGTNNIINNNVMYVFRVNADGCDARLLIEFENVETCCDGILQLNVVPLAANQDCDVAFNSIISDGISNGECFQYRPAGNIIPNGNYLITIDGQDGKLVRYDLKVSVTYDNCIPSQCCDAPIAIATELSSCDDGSGTATFDLTKADSIANDGSANLVQYYEDFQATVPITSTSAYTIMTADAPVTVFATTDNGICESAPVEITLNVSLFTIDDIIAIDAENGMDNGSIEVAVSGGNPPYTVAVEDMEIIGNGPTFNFTELSAGSYTITITDNNGCTIMGNTDIMVGIDQIDELTTLNIAPNPTQGMVTVEMELSSPEIINLKMYDITGKVINQIVSEKTTANSFEFDMSNQAAGIYMLRIQVGNNSLVRRIIVRP